MSKPKSKAVSKKTPKVEGHPEACLQVAATAPVPFLDAVAILRAWRRRHPGALQLDGHPGGKNNLKPWLHFKLDGFTSPAHDFVTKHSQEHLLGRHYNGVWNFHGDAKASAIDGLLRLVAEGGKPLEFLQQTATHEQKAEHAGDQNPKLTMRESTGIKDFYVYKV